MDAGVFLLQDDETLVRMNERPYAAEALLQRLLATHPDLLAGDQIDPDTPRRWLLVEREAGVPAAPGGTDWWAVDHLFLDQDAVPTFVEVKRATDTRARREVVAQMLDYAANATEYWPVERMREIFARRCDAARLDPTQELRELLGPESDETAFWDQARDNLRLGRVRLLFVADRIPASLRRIVEFLNRQMNPAEVLAVEVRQFAPDAGPALRTLVPRVIGQTEQTRAATPPSRPRSQPTPISREEFEAGIGDDLRHVALAVLAAAAAAASGFDATGFRRSGERVSAPLTRPDVQGVPVTLTEDFLTNRARAASGKQPAASNQRQHDQTRATSSSIRAPSNAAKGLRAGHPPAPPRPPPPPPPVDRGHDPDSTRPHRRRPPEAFRRTRPVRPQPPPSRIGRMKEPPPIPPAPDAVRAP